MSKLTDLVTDSTALSLAAVEEASRFGVREVDLEHLLLALVISERPAGEVLRGLSISLDAARAAVADHHREQLASLGIEAKMPGDGRIRFHEQGGYDINERTLQLMSQAGGWKKAGDSLEILKSLVAEPSGTIADILSRLGTDPDAVLAAVAAAEAAPAAPRRTTKDPLSRIVDAFVPAPPAEVWALVSDPLRLPEWDVNIETVEPDRHLWRGRTRTVAPDGRTLKVRDDQRHQLIERVACAEPRVSWRIRYPDAPRANARLIDIALAAAEGGTTVTLTHTWERGAGPRGPLRVIAPVTRFLARPLVGFVTTFAANTLTAGISRALRDG